MMHFFQVWALIWQSLFSQSIPFPGPGRASAVGPSTYTFSEYTYLVESAGPDASRTSPALTLTTGDLVCVTFRGAPDVSTTFTSTPSNTFTTLTKQSWIGATAAFQMGCILNAASGSTTFTATPSSSMTFSSMVVLRYTHTGAAAAADTDSGGNSVGSVTTFTSGTFNTAANALTIFCVTWDGNRVATAGMIGGNSATLRGVANSTLGSTTNQACEDTYFSGAQTGITSDITVSSAATNWGYTNASFK